MFNFELVVCVVNCGHGSKALKIAKKHRVRGGTIFIGKGTVKNKLLDILDLNDVRKEIVLMIAEKDAAAEAMATLNTEMSFHKKNHGIVFSIPLSTFIRSKLCKYYDINDNKEVKETMYSAIFTVVNKGLAEDVVETAATAGAKGGTIINARGSSANETEILFAMPIEPEKEIVMILAKNDIVEAITSAIREKLRIDESGNGVIFITSLNEAFGLY